MLMYDLGKRALSQENMKLLRINVDVIEAIKREISAVLEKEERGLLPDEAASKDEFMILVSLALRHGIEAGAIADRLGVTVSTVHRWARGTFVPAQSFVRDAVLAGIRDLLQGELERFSAIDPKGAHGKPADPIPDELTPKIDVDARKSGGPAPDTVVPLRSRRSGKPRRGGNTVPGTVAIGKVI